MIISKTPFRISFCGGGTDLREFYSIEQGAVTSTAINKYMYITVNKKFDNEIRLSYSKTENVKNVDEIQHPIVREALKLAGIEGGLEITSMADIPSKGTGLGSSSSFTAGLLNALYSYKGMHKSAKSLAEEACKIEIDILKEPIGKQDQYIAAFGGLQHIQFMPDEQVFVDPIICSNSTKKELDENLMLFYTGITRKASEILSEQKEKTKDKIDMLRKMRDLAIEIKESLNNNDLNNFGELMHKNWLLKKSLVGSISNNIIDSYYEKARKNGALGGKILGAGGGGFLCLYCEKEKQNKVREALKGLREEHFRLEPQGTKIIYVEE